jgi:hypothetical protein
MSELTNLPANTPAEIIEISPEALECANCYLQLQDINKVAEELDIPVQIVSHILAKREVRSYIDNVFMNVGFNNRFKMRKAMDAIIARKFRDLDESETGSTKDIAELLALSHKMSMELMDKEIQLKKIDAERGSGPKSQVNVQINENGSNYGSLIERLINNQI